MTNQTTSREARQPDETLPRLEAWGCTVCGETDVRFRYAVRDRWFDLPGEFRVVECRRCGHVYLNPRPEESAVGFYYPAGYTPHQGYGANQLQKVWFAYLKLFNAHLQLLADLTPGKLLDVGCGAGEYLQLMKGRGWVPQGVDISASAAAMAQQRGIPVFVGDLAAARFPEASFDAVTLLHVLEHLYDPGRVLDEIHRLLNDRGVLVIEVPNIASAEARLFGPAWWHLDAPRHVNHFAPAALQALLAAHGFRVESWGFSPSPVSMAGSLNYVLNKRLSGVLRHRVLRYAVYGLLPLSSLLALLKSGAAMAVRARKIPTEGRRTGEAGAR